MKILKITSMKYYSCVDFSYHFDSLCDVESVLSLFDEITQYNIHFYHFSINYIPDHCVERGPDVFNSLDELREALLNESDNYFYEYDVYDIWFKGRASDFEILGYIHPHSSILSCSPIKETIPETFSELADSLTNTLRNLPGMKLLDHIAHEYPTSISIQYRFDCLNLLILLCSFGIYGIEYAHSVIELEHDHTIEPRPTKIPTLERFFELCNTDLSDYECITIRCKINDVELIDCKIDLKEFTCRIGIPKGTIPQKSSDPDAKKVSELTVSQTSITQENNTAKLMSVESKKSTAPSDKITHAATAVSQASKEKSSSEQLKVKIKSLFKNKNASDKLNRGKGSLTKTKNNNRMENYTLFFQNETTYEIETVYAYTEYDCIYMCGLTQEKCGDSYGTVYGVSIEKIKSYFLSDTTEQLLAHLKIMIHSENDIKKLLKKLHKNGIEHTMWIL